MLFGDILKTKNDTYMVLDINNEMHEVGTYTIEDWSEVIIDISIPFCICKQLSNAESFYSKLYDYKSFKKADEVNLGLCIKYNDELTIKHFDGPFDPEYESIEIQYFDGQLSRVHICFVEGYTKTFFPTIYKFNNQDIEMFFALRKDKKNLVKIKLELEAEDQHKFDIQDYHRSISILWETFVDYADMSHQCLIIQYVGPESEKNKLIKTLREVYKEKFDDIVSIDKMNDTNYLSSKFFSCQ